MENVGGNDVKMVSKGKEDIKVANGVIELSLVEENEKIKDVIDKLKVLQPKIVHGRHRQVVEYKCVMPRKC